MSKTANTQAVIEGMVDGLNDHRIDDIGQFFAETTGKDHFKLLFQTKYVLTRRVYTWGSGQLLLADKRQLTPVLLWELSLRVNALKFVTWIFGK